MKCASVIDNCDEVHSRFDIFLNCCQGKSELCQYAGVFQPMVSIIKQLIATLPIVMYTGHFM